MKKDDLIKKIEIAQAAFEQTVPGLKNQVGIELIKSTLQSVIMNLEVPTPLKTVCKDMMSLLDEFASPRKGDDKLRLLINHNFARLKIIANRWKL